MTVLASALEVEPDSAESSSIRVKKLEASSTDAAADLLLCLPRHSYSSKRTRQTQDVKKLEASSPHARFLGSIRNIQAMLPPPSLEPIQVSEDEGAGDDVYSNATRIMPLGFQLLNYSDYTATAKLKKRRRIRKPLAPQPRLPNFANGVVI
jgi:hypothetical protein